MADDGLGVAPAPAPSEVVASSVVPRTSVGPMDDVLRTLAGDVSFGETEIGHSWCVKALHPANNAVISAPVPTNETRAVTSVGFNQMDLFSIPVGFSANLPWNLTLRVHRDPVLLYSYVYSQTGSADVVGYIYSRQIGNPANYLAAYAALRENCERFRISSHSLTGYFDGASLSDQGHVVVGQTELPRLNANNWPDVVPLNNFGAQLPVTFYQDPVPTYDQILQTTRPYQGHAKEGFYAPSKLLNVGTWVNTNQSWMLLGTALPTGALGHRFGQLGQTAEAADESVTIFFGTYPYMRLTAQEPFPLVFEQTDSSLTTIFYTGLASTTSVRFTMRWTMDMVVRPGTVYAPFSRMPPEEDRSALRMYAEVSRRMEDAYPSRYNNLGALLPVLKGIVGTLAPKVIPRLGSWITERVRAKRLGAKAPSALELIMPSLGAEEAKRLSDLRMLRAAGVELTPDQAAEYSDLFARMDTELQRGPVFDVTGAASDLASTFLRSRTSRSSGTRKSTRTRSSRRSRARSRSPPPRRRRTSSSRRSSSGSSKRRRYYRY